MKKEFRAHPFMILRFLKPFLFILVFPLLKGGIEFLKNGQMTGILQLEILSVIIILILGFFSFDAFKITFFEDCFEIKEGFIIKRRSVIPYNKVSSARLYENPLDRLLKLVRISVNTESGRKNKSDFVLYIRKSEIFKLTELLGFETNLKYVKTDIKGLLIMSLAKSSVLGGIIIGVPVINRIGKLLGIAIDKILFEELSGVADSLNTYFPPVVNLISISLGLLYLVSFSVTFLKSLRLAFARKGDNYSVRKGVLTKRRIFFKKNAINNLLIEQKPIMRFFGRFSLIASVGGYKDKKGDLAVIIPASSKTGIERKIKKDFAEFLPTAPFIRPSRGFKSFRRFIWVPIIYQLLWAAAFMLSYSVFPAFKRLSLFVYIVVALLLCYFALISYLNYSEGELSFGRVIVAKGSRGLSFNELRLKKENLGVIRLLETPADRKYCTCKVTLTVRSENADTIRVRNLDKSAIEEKISNIYA